MTDDKPPHSDPAQRAATPNRGARRTPPTIEGEARPLEERQTANPAAQADMPAQTESPAQAEPQAAGEARSPLDPAPEAQGANAATEATRPTNADGPDPAEASTGVATADAAPATEPAHSGGSGLGMGALAGASLGAAVLAALLVWGLQNFSGGEPAIPVIETRLADVERRAAAMQETQLPAGALQALEKRIASAESLAGAAGRRSAEAEEVARKALAAAQESPSPAADAKGLAALEQRLAALDKRTAGDLGSAVAALSALGARLEAVEKALAAPKTDARATDENRTEARVALQPAEPAPAPVDLGPLRERAEAMEGRLAGFAERLDALSRDVEALAARAPEADKRLADVENAAAQARKRLEELQASVAPLSGEIAASTKQATAARAAIAKQAAESASDAARVSAAQSLVATLGTGAPFAAHLEALARLGAAPDRIEALKPFAASGAPTRQALARDFAKLEEQMAARDELPPGASLVERLSHSAAGLVRVRPAGEAAGDAPAGSPARVTAALERGDLAGALKAHAALPEQARTASAEWARAARARLAAEEAARAILDDAVARLGRS